MRWCFLVARAYRLNDRGGRGWRKLSDQQSQNLVPAIVRNPRQNVMVAQVSKREYLGLKALGQLEGAEVLKESPVDEAE